uniref:Uncharacterized protein n=1 Tax=Anguilla anguilla TaxID=7936 RepID=A0A0E9X3K4_ANGAN
MFFQSVLYNVAKRPAVLECTNLQKFLRWKQPFSQAARNPKKALLSPSWFMAISVLAARKPSNSSLKLRDH